MCDISSIWSYNFKSLQIECTTCYNSCNYVCSSYFHYWFSICKKLMLENLLKKKVRWLCITSKCTYKSTGEKWPKKSMKSYMNFTTSVCAGHEPIFLWGEGRTKCRQVCWLNIMHFQILMYYYQGLFFQMCELGGWWSGSGLGQIWWEVKEGSGKSLDSTYILDLFHFHILSVAKIWLREGESRPFLLPSFTSGQIWLSSLVEDCQPTCFTKLENKHRAWAGNWCKFSIYLLSGLHTTPVHWDIWVWFAALFG